MIRSAAILSLLALAACEDRSEAPSIPPESMSPPEAAAPSKTYSATPPPGVELPPSQTTEGPVPLEFRHVWAIDPADCTKDPGLTRIAIAPGAVKSYEGRSEIVSAEAPHEGALVMQVKHSAEGETAQETHTLALDKGKLSYGRRGQTFTYTRCD